MKQLYQPCYFCYLPKHQCTNPDHNRAGTLKEYVEAWHKMREQKADK